MRLRKLAAAGAMLGALTLSAAPAVATVTTQAAPAAVHLADTGMHYHG